MADIWSEALHGLEPRLDKQTFDMWLRPIRLTEVDGDLLHLRAPNRFLKEWFETHYLDCVLDELAARHEKSFRVAIEVVEEPEPSVAVQVIEVQAEPRERRPAHTPPIDELRTGSARHPLPTGLHPRYRFESFIKGACNELAASAAMAAADEPGRRFNPLFIYGGVGLGKTHLLHGVGHELHRKDPSLRIVVLSAEQFMNEFVTAVRHAEFDEFRARYRRDCDCLLIDDIQFIAGRDRTMDEFFHVFNALYEAGKQIVVTADRVPGDMAGMEERLTSRLNWGLVADVQAPDLETRIAILQAKAERDAIDLPSGVALAIAELIRSNVRELEGALLRATTFAQLRGLPLDERFVRDLLGRGAPSERAPITIEAVQKAVAAYYSVRVTDLKGKRRHKGIARPRMVAMYLCRQLTGASFPEIGTRFGGKDHSTVINACRRIETLKAEEAELEAAVESLKAQLSA